MNRPLRTDMAMAARPPSLEPSTQSQFGMWVFIGTEALFFGGLLLAYAWGRASHPEGFTAASRHTDIVLGTLNTAVLLCSSALAALAALHAREAAWPSCRRCLLAAAGLGVLFLCIKGAEYRQEWTEGLFPGPGFRLGDDHTPPVGSAMFFQFYFTATALHALHLMIGIGLMVWQALHPPPPDHPGQAVSRVEATTLYWHFVDMVWIVLYPLLYLGGRHP